MRAKRNQLGRHLARGGRRLFEKWPWLPRVVTGTVVASAIVVAYSAFGLNWGRPDGDPWNYLAAGERLNAGHPLYALSPGDRSVITAPPYWTVPLLAPPPIAVAWRPLALLGDLSMWVWGLAGAIATVAAMVFLARRGALASLAVLALPVALTALSGNASAILLPMLIAAYVFRDRPWIVGTLIALAAAVKLTPLALVLWLIATGRHRAVIVCGVVLLGVALVSAMGAGPEAFAAWLEAVADAAPSPRSMASLTGLPTVVVAAVLALPVVVLCGRDRASFAAAVVATSLATPAFYFPALALLVALPFWRDARGDGARRRRGDSDPGDQAIAP